jgi:hypothetical protein
MDTINMAGMADMNEVVIVFVIFSSLTFAAIIIGIVAYLCKRLEHKQIMTAIEQGVPVSQLKAQRHEPAGPVWIKYLTGGIILFFVGLAFFAAGPGLGDIRGMGAFAGLILCGVGIAWLIRGLLYRKHATRDKPVVIEEPAESNHAVSASHTEVSQKPVE